MKNGILLLVSLLTIAVAHAQRMNLQKMINYHVYSTVHFDKVPCVLVGVIAHDTVQIFAYGTIKKGTQTPPNEHTVFELGVASMALTTTLVNNLSEQGKLSYQQTIDTLLPIGNHKNIQILDLLTHTSGLPNMPFNFGQFERNKKNPYAAYPPDKLLEFVHDYHPDPDTLKKYRYSRSGFALLELALRRIEQRSFEAMLIQQLCEPVGMTDTRITLTDDMAHRLAQGYDEQGTPVNTWTYSTFGGAIGIKSTLHDLVRYLSIQMGRLPNYTTYSKAWSADHIKTFKTDIPKVDIGRGWHLIHPTKKFFPIIGHSGNTEGHRVYMGFVKETQTGVIVLSNSNITLDGLGSAILQSLNYNWKKKLALKKHNR